MSIHCFECAAAKQSMATKRPVSKISKTNNKKPKIEVADLFPNIIDGSFLEQKSKATEETAYSQDGKVSEKTGDKEKTASKKKEDMMKPVNEVANLLPNIIDGDFVKEVTKEEEEAVQTGDDMELVTKPVAEKKVFKKKPKLPELIIPKPPYPKNEEPKNDKVIDKPIFICPDCQTKFNRKFKRNRHVYIAHKKMTDQLEEIIKMAKKRAYEETVSDCQCFPVVVICIE